MKRRKSCSTKACRSKHMKLIKKFRKLSTELTKLTRHLKNW